MDNETYKGKVKCTGVDGFTGKEVSVDIEFGQATTIDGVFHAFQSHYALARRDGFAAEVIKDPVAEKAAAERKAKLEAQDKAAEESGKKAAKDK